jgi:ADP-heptose:LPS heptosyltransferase
MRITVVVRLSSLGDVAILIPALYPVARDNPRDRFILLTKKPFVELFVNKPDNLEIFAVDTLERHKGFWGVFRCLYDIRKHIGRIQGRDKTSTIQIADMHDVIRSKLLRFFFAVKRSKIAVINKNRKAKRALTRRGNKILQPLKTSYERYCEVFNRLGYTAQSTYTGLFSAKPEHKDRRIGVAPFAAHKGKVYPYDRMEYVVKELNEWPDTKIFLFGGQKESSLLEAWTEKYTNSESLAGALPFPDELAIINSLDLMLSMDSANMHLASLVNTPVVSIWGATHPYTGFYGFNQPAENAVQVPLDCRPCSVFGEKKCVRGDYACMKLISHEDVLKKIAAICKANSK